MPDENTDINNNKEVDHLKGRDSGDSTIDIIQNNNDNQKKLGSHLSDKMVKRYSFLFRLIFCFSKLKFLISYYIFS